MAPRPHGVQGLGAVKEMILSGRGPDIYVLAKE